MSINKLYTIFKKYPIICTDSRHVINNSLFFALKGENFNGNQFAKQALQSGCKYAIIDEKEYNSDNCILVKNVLETLQSLATYHREKLNIPIIGITGTNGKTTTKELIRQVISSTYNTHATEGNLNNQIGVPLSILSINNTHEIAIIEMGANQIGEIEKLCKIVKPTVGIITNIGMAHLKGFVNFDGIIKTKTELYSFINETNGVIFVNSNDNLLLEKSKNNQKITYGNGINTDYPAEMINKFPFVSVRLGKTNIHSKLIGKFQYDNIIAACCIGNFFNVSLNNIKSEIEDYTPKNNRSEIIETKTNYIILDAYNANPSSMHNMIDSFNELKKENKVCILGDMKELGKYSKDEHKKIIQKMNILKIDTFYIGKLFCKSTSINSFLSISDFLKRIKDFNLQNKTILIKGSRGVRLEKLIKSL